MIQFEIKNNNARNEWIGKVKNDGLKKSESKTFFYCDDVCQWIMMVVAGELLHPSYPLNSKYEQNKVFFSANQNSEINFNLNL